MNTYKKYCPNVFVAKCEEEHEKGDTIVLTTKYDKEHENIVHNFLGKTTDGFYLYSITREDGFNSQERAKNKADKLKGYADNADKRSTEAWKKSDLSEASTGIVFGQPILVGHHSERGHRRTIERADNAMRKSVEERDKAEVYASRAKYWESQANKINLSMPESLEFFEYKLHTYKELHKLYKEHPEKREHSYSLTYANKAVKEAKKSLEIAVNLWGDEEQVKQIAQEKEEIAIKKVVKTKKHEDLITKYGGFFAFNTEQFKAGYSRLKREGHVLEGEKAQHVIHGLYIPSKNVDAYLDEL